MTKLRVYDKQSGSFATTTCVQESYPIPPFLNNFVIDDLVGILYEVFKYVDVKLANREKLCELDYVYTLV